MFVLRVDVAALLLACCCATTTVDHADYGQAPFAPHNDTAHDGNVHPSAHVHSINPDHYVFDEHDAPDQTLG